VVLAPNESVALANLLVSPKEIAVSDATFQDVAKARAYKYSVKALREEREDVTIEDLSAAQVTRHLRLDFFFVPVFHSTYFMASMLAATYTLTVGFQAYESGVLAASSGIATFTSDHDSIVSILNENFQDTKKQLSAFEEKVTAMIQNQKREARNRRAFADDGLLILPFKTEPGHPSRAPQDAKLKELQGVGPVPVPVPVGSCPPSLPFYPKKGLAISKIIKLTDTQINDLEWYYNEVFSEAGEM
jgi:hypothetical protein